MKPDYILCKKLSTKGKYMRMARKKILIWKLHYILKYPCVKSNIPVLELYILGSQKESYNTMDFTQKGF